MLWPSLWWYWIHFTRSDLLFSFDDHEWQESVDLEGQYSLAARFGSCNNSALAYHHHLSHHSGSLSQSVGIRLSGCVEAVYESYGHHNCPPNRISFEKACSRSISRKAFEALSPWKPHLWLVCAIHSRSVGRLCRAVVFG